MTNEEAKYYLSRLRDSLDSLSESKLIEALDMAIKVLERNIEKEPVQTHVRWGMGYDYHDYYCPSCDAFLASEPIGLRFKQRGERTRCKNCFQMIKWEVENDE